MKASLPFRQKGAAAIEFAAVFMIFFAVFYGVISYSLPLLMLQSFNEASSEAVRRSVAVDGSSLTPAVYQTTVISLARSVVSQRLAWMPASLGFNAQNDAKITFTGNLLTVRIDYAKTRLNQVIPFIVLPVIGEVPNLPDTLSAEASLQL